MALNDHDYVARLEVTEVTEALKAMDVAGDSDGEETAKKKPRLEQMATARESGVDLAFDALMELEANGDLSAFLRQDDLEMTWKIPALEDAIRSQLPDDDDGEEVGEEITEEEDQVTILAEVEKPKGFYKLRSRTVETR